MDESIGSSGSAAIFSTLNVGLDYWQVPIGDEDEDDTSFKSNKSIYPLNSMPFGQIMVLVAFQHCLHIISNRLAWETCLACIDNSIILAKDQQYHISHLNCVLNILLKRVASHKPEKIRFFITV